MKRYRQEMPSRRRSRMVQRSPASAWRSGLAPLLRFRPNCSRLRWKTSSTKILLPSTTPSEKDRTRQRRAWDIGGHGQQCVIPLPLAGAVGLDHHALEPFLPERALAAATLVVPLGVFLLEGFDVLAQVIHPARVAGLDQLGGGILPRLTVALDPVGYAADLVGITSPPAPSNTKPQSHKRKGNATAKSY